MWCVRGFPACAPYGNEKMQEPLGRKRSLGPMPLGRVHSDDARAAPLTAELWLETQKRVLGSASRGRDRYPD